MPWRELKADNAPRAFAERDVLERVEGPDQAQVRAEIDPSDGGRIAIRDNAAVFARRITCARLPTGRNGLSHEAVACPSLGWA